MMDRVRQPELFTCYQISSSGPSYFIESNINRLFSKKRRIRDPTRTRKGLKLSDSHKPTIFAKMSSHNMEAGFRQLLSLCSILSRTWREPAGVRIFFLIGLYCLLSEHVSSATIQCPHSCACFNYSVQEEGTLLSMNCSGVGLQYALELNASAPQEHPLNHTASTNVSLPMLEYYFDPALYYLDLSHNNLTVVKPDVQSDMCCFNRTIRVKVLIFSFNIISQIDAGDFSAYTDMVHLDLSHNAIKWVDEDAFTGLKALTQLNLSYNKIEDLANTTFQSLNSLRILDLSNNYIHVFPLGKLPVLSSLQYLYLKNNHLQSLTSPVCDVANLQNLVFLDLSNNNMTQIPSGTFKMLSSLRTLHVSNNSIQEVSEHLLKGLNNLENLVLDHNCISAIRYPIFKNTSLIKLSMSNMPFLSNISHDAFRGLRNLVYLNLSHNHQLTFLQPNLFTALTNLAVLDVSNSNLTELSQITFHQNKNLQEVFILNNPLSCSCTNAWLMSQASKNHTPFVNSHSLYCLSENGIQTALHNATFSCEDISIHNTSARVSAKLGSQLLFKCQHDTRNPGIVMWTTPSGSTFYQHHFHPDASQHLLSPGDIQPGSDFHKGHYWHHTSSYHSELSSSETRVSILSDGSLFIDYMLQSDAGKYECRVSNAQYNDTITIKLYVDCALGNDVKVFAYIVGLICALTFFTLNLIYVIISWIARRLVNKRRREIIRQMLENLNGYKSTQIARIHENYTHQLNRVRNQYHTQCSRLHKNYTSQVTKMKRGCSNQVEKVRDNYNSKLHQLREYSSNQILQIRERTNCQIVRIRDYGTTQLDKLRETYKLQQQHVLKLLDTMNLENCRNIVETECMRAESMMYDIDLLGDDDRTDSPSSPADSEYSTAVSSPSSSLDDPESAGLRRDMSQKQRDLGSDSSENSQGVREVQTTIDLEPRVPMESADSWKYDLDRQYEINNGCDYLMNIYCPGDELLLELPAEPTLPHSSGHSQKVAAGIPLPTLNLRQDQSRINVPDRKLVSSHKKSDSDVNSDALYMTPEASPTKMWSDTRRPPLASPTKIWSETRRPSKEASPTKVWSETRRPPVEASPTKVWPEIRSPLTFEHNEKHERSQRNKELNSTNLTNDNDSLNESIV